MKIIGIILIALQVVGLIPDLVAGRDPFDGNMYFLLGRFLLLIVGIVLIVKSKKK